MNTEERRQQRLDLLKKIREEVEGIRGDIEKLKGIRDRLAQERNNLVHEITQLQEVKKTLEQQEQDGQEKFATNEAPALKNTLETLKELHRETTEAVNSLSAADEPPTQTQ